MCIHLYKKKKVCNNINFGNVTLFTALFFYKLMSSLRPLSVFLPSSWQQQEETIKRNKRPTSVYSQTSSSSLNQTSLQHAKKNLSFIFYQENKEEKAIKKNINEFKHILLLCLNDCSIGYYRITEHIHRKVPRIVETKKKIQQTNERVKTAVSDIEDIKKNLDDIERIESFYNMNKMIQKTLKIIGKQNR
ncbi:MAG: hypothetical protein EXX96DRAFT_364038 [Benjaminiella poitrasii]|nr:MAG: hypothetical protein EXX96DRAFT_364038 [Benjaminiella poitrasii]